MKIIRKYTPLILGSATFGFLSKYLGGYLCDKYGWEFMMGGDVPIMVLPMFGFGLISMFVSIKTYCVLNGEEHHVNNR